MRYAVIKNNKINQILEADFDAEIRLLELAFPDSDIVKETNETGIAHKNSYFKNGVFSAPQPMPSWVFDFEKFYWIPPKPIPEGNGPFIWNEDKLDWE